MNAPPTTAITNTSAVQRPIAAVHAPECMNPQIQNQPIGSLQCNLPAFTCQVLQRACRLSLCLLSGLSLDLSSFKMCAALPPS